MCVFIGMPFSAIKSNGFHKLKQFNYQVHRLVNQYAGITGHLFDDRIMSHGIGFHGKGSHGIQVRCFVSKHSV